MPVSHSAERDDARPRPETTQHLTDDDDDPTRQFVYNHDEYWPTLLQVAMDKRNRQKATWKALGGTVGISEYDYKTIGETSTGAPSGTSSSIAPPAAQRGSHERMGTSVSSATSSDGATLHDAHGLNDPDVHDGHLKVLHTEPEVMTPTIVQKAG